MADLLQFLLCIGLALLNFIGVCVVLFIIVLVIGIIKEERKNGHS